MSITLGLDLGPNSIGWALVNETTLKIVDLGVRIFPEGVDNFDTSKEKSRNEDRRIARGMRRQIARRRRRTQRLTQGLIAAGLWPDDAQQQQALIEQDPYALRSQAADADQPTLAPHALGRVLLHLNQRRGFLSNSKGADTETKSEAEGMKAEIGGLRGELQDANQTLGQFLHVKNRIDHATRGEDDRVRQRHTERAMLEHELEVIAARHPDLLTPQVLYGTQGQKPLKGRKPVPRADTSGQTLYASFGLHGLLFFQRKLYWPKSMIGLCELDPKQPRCPIADRFAQRFRLLQEVNGLRYIDPDTNQENTLSDEQRSLVLEKLGKKDKLPFNGKNGIKAALGFLESVRFNLEKGDRSKLQGHITDTRAAKAVKGWHALDDDRKTQAIAALTDPNRDDDEAITLLTQDLSFTEKQADALLSLDLPTGYAALSKKALTHGSNGTGLVAAMERGLLYQSGEGLENGQPTDAIHAAGYLRRDELQRHVFGQLPDPARIPDAPIGDIPNPVVRRTLVELRKLVNAVIKQHGKPDAIHVEMARDVKQGERARKEFTKTMREREGKRDAAADHLRENAVRVTRDAINRHLLWEEQGRLCPYSGNSISFTQLTQGGQIDVDHILPYSKCLDDSLMNKVVCFRRENDQKGNRHPHAWLADAEPSRYETVCQRAKNLPYPKYKRFLLKHLELDGFIARQLVDTAYIARATSEYLRCLFEKKNEHAVLGLKGQLTAELRHQWAMNGILRNDTLDVKSRDDHRHHAVDAIVIALTNRKRLQQLTRIRKQGGVKTTGESLDLPWDSFYEDAEAAVNQINVSHRAARKVAGKLHEDTLYAPHRGDDGKVHPDAFVVRKPIETLTANEIPNIRDDAIRATVERRLAEHGLTAGRGKKLSVADLKTALAQPLHVYGQKKGTLGPQIKKVRIVKNEKTIRPIRGGDTTAHVKPGSTHHLSLFRYGPVDKPKFEGVWTTMLDAADRLKQQAQALALFKSEFKTKHGKSIGTKDPRMGQAMQKIGRAIPLITVNHPDRPESEFCFSLSRGEMVLAQIDGRQELLSYNTSASTQGQIYFHHHTDARSSSERKKIAFKASTLFSKGQARKVTVDYLGRIRWAND